MSAESFLSAVVEIAIAIAGFAGIVAAIRHRDIDRWALEEQILLRMLFTASGAAICFALLPAVLSEAGLPGPTIWRAGSISLLLFLFAIGAGRTRQFRKAGLVPKLPRAMPVWVICSALLQALNIHLEASWPYLVGTFLIVLNGFTFFLMLLFGNTSEDDEAIKHS